MKPLKVSLYIFHRFNLKYKQNSEIEKKWWIDNSRPPESGLSMSVMVIICYLVIMYCGFFDLKGHSPKLNIWMKYYDRWTSATWITLPKLHYEALTSQSLITWF